MEPNKGVDEVKRQGPPEPKDEGVDEIKRQGLPEPEDEGVDEIKSQGPPEPENEGVDEIKSQSPPQPEVAGVNEVKSQGSPEPDNEGPSHQESLEAKRREFFEAKRRESHESKRRECPHTEKVKKYFNMTRQEARGYDIHQGHLTGKVQRLIGRDSVPDIGEVMALDEYSTNLRVSQELERYHEMDAKRDAEEEKNAEPPRSKLARVLGERDEDVFMDNRPMKPTHFFGVPPPARAFGRRPCSSDTSSPKAKEQEASSEQHSGASTPRVPTSPTPGSAPMTLSNPSTPRVPTSPGSPHESSKSGSPKDSVSLEPSPQAQ